MHRQPRVGDCGRSKTSRAFPNRSGMQGGFGNLTRELVRWNRMPRHRRNGGTAPVARILNRQTVIVHQRTW